MSTSKVITDRYVFDAYGNDVAPALHNTTEGNALRFRWNGSYGYRTLYLLTGQQTTNTATLMHAGARHYSPSLRRWLQRDPIDLGGGDPNLYRYTGANPVGMVDPEGLQGKTSPSTTSGQRTIAELAMGDLKAARLRGICETDLWRFWDGKWIKHHLFPKALAEKFKRIGIFVNEKGNIVSIPSWFHLWLHSNMGVPGSTTQGGWWNFMWKQFFALYEKGGERFGQKPTMADAIEWLHMMLKSLGAKCGEIKIADLLSSRPPAGTRRR